ncbi:MAG: UbiA-like protein EboC [Bacteroidota bacterium]
MSPRLLAYLRLMRPANIVTAFADILAGCAIAFALGSGEEILLFARTNGSQILLLLVSTLGLYGGGVVFNDVFDFNLDKVERPERPLPSGAASLKGAILLGTGLFLLGVLAALGVSWQSGLLALTIVLLVLSYNSWAKHHTVFGPVNMGLCRAGNLLLGVSILPTILFQIWPIGTIPLLYIGAITLVSQGEVHGGNRKALQLAYGMYVVVFVIVIAFGLVHRKNVLYALPFIAFLVYLTLPPLQKAIKSLQPQDIMKAVKAGVIALIVLNSAIAAIFGGIIWGLFIVCLLPLSRWLAKAFAVT